MIPASEKNQETEATFERTRYRSLEKHCCGNVLTDQRKVEDVELGTAARCTHGACRLFRVPSCWRVLVGPAFDPELPPGRNLPGAQQTPQTQRTLACARGPPLTGGEVTWGPCPPPGSRPPRPGGTDPHSRPAPKPASGRGWQGCISAPHGQHRASPQVCPTCPDPDLSRSSGTWASGAPIDLSPPCAAVRWLASPRMSRWGSGPRLPRSAPVLCLEIVGRRRGLSRRLTCRHGPGAGLWTQRGRSVPRQRHGASAQRRGFQALCRGVRTTRCRVFSVLSSHKA